MKQKTIIVLFLTSLVAHGILLKSIFSNAEDSEPLFDPFEINYGVTENSLLTSGYKPIPEDVPLLGQQIGDTLIYYQLNYECDDQEDIEKIRCRNTDVNWRSCVIPLYKIDRQSIEDLVNKYDAFVISNVQTIYGHVDSAEYRAQFFTEHKFTHQIFECFIEKVEKHQTEFELSISTRFPANEIRPTTSALNEWDFIGQDTFVGIGKSATRFK